MSKPPEIFKENPMAFRKQCQDAQGNPIKAGKFLKDLVDLKKKERVRGVGRGLTSETTDEFLEINNLAQSLPPDND